MKKTVLFTAMLLMMSSVTISACAQSGIRASRNYVTKKYDYTGTVTAVELIGWHDLEWTPSSNGQTTVELYGSDNIIDYLVVDIDNGRLVTKVESGLSINGDSRLTVRVSSPYITEAFLTGSGDIVLKGTVKSPSLALKLKGSGDIVAVNVEAENFSAFIEGSGDIKAKKVGAQNSSVKLNGSGDINIDRIDSENIAVELVGSGDIKINKLMVANLTTSLKGSGDIYLTGECERASYTLSNSGDIWASKMTAVSTSATLSGSGDIRCHAYQNFHGKASGSGTIAYSGNPANVTTEGKEDNFKKFTKA